MSFVVSLADIDSVNVVLIALSKAPISWEMADPLIQSIKAQVGAQLAAQEAEIASNIASKEPKSNVAIASAENSSV